MPDQRKQNIMEAIERVRSDGSYTAYLSLSGRLANAGPDREHSCKIAILRNATVEPLMPVIEGETALLGLSPDMYLCDFDTVAANIFNADSELYRHEPDLIILFQWLDGLSPALTDGFLSLSPDDVEAQIDGVIATLRAQIGALRQHSNVPVIINNFPMVMRATLGIYETAADGGETAAYEQLNRAVRSLAQDSENVFCLDLAGLYARIGSNNAFEDRHWSTTRTPVGRAALVPLGKEYGRYIRALNGKAMKCLVLDCDNTLWGGIIGEDGIEGIQLDQDYPGNGYLALQKEILNLYHRGVILTLCSKNNEEDVMEVFRNHPNMILKEEHIAAYRINWSDKAENILDLAKELNIGVDSMVFLDDSEFECSRVREALPMVEVMHLDGQSTRYRRNLREAGYFDALSYSSEDKKRTATFRANKQRKQLESMTTSLDDYLHSLQIRAEIRAVTDQQVPRISQLTQKTNQFNLTTHRYTESDIKRFMESADHDVLFLWFADKFAEFGIVGAAILEVAGDEAKIDSFIFSCRALGRGLEKALLAKLTDQAHQRGCRQLVGTYKKTPKNAQVADFYERNGFEAVLSEESGSVWNYDLAGIREQGITCPAWIEIL